MRKLLQGAPPPARGLSSSNPRSIRSIFASERNQNANGITLTPSMTNRGQRRQPDFQAVAKPRLRPKRHTTRSSLRSSQGLRRSIPFCSPFESSVSAELRCPCRVAVENKLEGLTTLARDSTASVASSSSTTTSRAAGFTSSVLRLSDTGFAGAESRAGFCLKRLGPRSPRPRFLCRPATDPNMRRTDNGRPNDLQGSGVVMDR